MYAKMERFTLINGLVSALIAAYLVQTRAPVSDPLGYLAAGSLVVSTLALALAYTVDNIDLRGDQHG